MGSNAIGQGRFASGTRKILGGLTQTGIDLRRALRPVALQRENGAAISKERFEALLCYWPPLCLPKTAPSKEASAVHNNRPPVPQPVRRPRRSKSTTQGVVAASLPAESLVGENPRSEPAHRATGHRYTQEERQAIIREAPRPLTDADWETLERLAHEYIEKIPTLTQAQMQWFKGRSREFTRKLKACSGVQTPEILEFMNCFHKLEAWAKAHYQPRMANRAQPAKNAYTVQIALLYINLGGYAGRDDNSPCVRFVDAVVNPVVAATGGQPKSAVHVMRRFVWRQLRPALLINKHEFFPVSLNHEP
jgi:hypothetical protein